MLSENQKNGYILDDAAKILLENVDKLNTSSNQAAERLEETAAALEEVTSSVKESSNKMTKISEFANSVTTSASHGQKLATKNS